MTTSTLSRLAPGEVHDALARHIFADGFDLILDLEKSQGSYNASPGADGHDPARAE